MYVRETVQIAATCNTRDTEEIDNAFLAILGSSTGPIMCEPRDLSDLLLTLCVWNRMRFREEVFTERDVKFTNISVQRFLLKMF